MEYFCFFLFPVYLPFSPNYHLSPSSSSQLLEIHTECHKFPRILHELYKRMKRHFSPSSPREKYISKTWYSFVVCASSRFFFLPCSFYCLCACLSIRLSVGMWMHAWENIQVIRRCLPCKIMSENLNVKHFLHLIALKIKGFASCFSENNGNKRSEWKH